MQLSPPPIIPKLLIVLWLSILIDEITPKVFTGLMHYIHLTKSQTNIYVAWIEFISLIVIKVYMSPFYQLVGFFKIRFDRKFVLLYHTC